MITATGRPLPITPFVRYLMVMLWVDTRTMEQHESTTAARTPEQVGLSFLTLAHGGAVVAALRSDAHGIQLDSPVV